MEVDHVLIVGLLHTDGERVGGVEVVRDQAAGGVGRRDAVGDS